MEDPTWKPGELIVERHVFCGIVHSAAYEEMKLPMSEAHHMGWAP